MLEKIGDRIRECRIMRGLSQAQLAEKLDIPRSAITAYENDTKKPKIEIREKIAHALDMDPVYLSGLELTEIDERRLLNRLLAKYASDIFDSVPARYDEGDPRVTVELSGDFHTLACKYNEQPDTFSKYRDLVVEQTDIDDERVAELDFWLKTWPKYDPVFSDFSENQAQTSLDYDSHLEHLHRLMIADFYQYQRKSAERV